MDEKDKSKLMKVVRFFAVILILVVVIEKAVMWRSYARRAEARRKAAITVSENDSVEVRMHSAALVAIATVEPESRTPFDFSPESLQNVDEMLRRLPSMVSETNRNEELYYSCVAWGAYVGEVFRNQYKSASWTENDNAEGGEVYAIHVGGQTIYPCQWAIDRLEKGESASVSRRYQKVRRLDSDEVYSMINVPLRRQMILSLSGGELKTAVQLGGGSGLTRHGYLKHITALCKAGILIQSPNPKDKRHPLYGLTPLAVVKKSKEGTTVDLQCCTLVFLMEK